MIARLAAAASLRPLPLLLLAACVATPGGARAPLVTDRPDFTESAEVVPSGAFQVESGATYAEERGGDVTTVGEILLRAGIRRRVELRVGLPSFVTDDYLNQFGRPARNRGFTDAAVGVKVAVHAPAPEASPLVPTVGVIVGSSFPTGTGGIEAGGVQPEAKLLLAWSVGDRVSLSSNVNWRRVDELHGASYHEPAASLSLGVALTDALGTFVETFAFAPDVAGSPRPAYVDGGLAWQPGPDLQLDVRVGVGVADAPDARFVGVGVSRRFW